MNANRGMYIEELVNITNSYYYSHNIALIEKRYLPIQIIKTINEKTILGKLLSKSYVDYCGVYQGKHLEFETKQTNETNFNLSLIKPHQMKHLIKAMDHQAFSFLIVYFNKIDKIYLIQTKTILQWKQEHKSNTIKFEYIQQHCKEIEITFPGIIDYLKLI